MSAPTLPPLNRWQRANMRGAARSFRLAYPVPSVLAEAITHRELSFVGRPLWERNARARVATARAMARHFPGAKATQ